MDHPQSARRRHTVLLFSLIAIIALLLCSCIVLYIRYRHLRARPVAGQQTLVTTLGKTLLLPNEQPAIVTVVDHAKLNDPELSAEAQNGDNLIIYNTARRVILYRPSNGKTGTTGKIIDIFHVETPATSLPAKTGTQSQPATR